MKLGDYLSTLLLGLVIIPPPGPGVIVAPSAAAPKLILLAFLFVTDLE